MYPEMRNITPQIVRSSFATWQFKLYQHGKTFQGQITAQSLDKLSVMMNTSSEMLKTVYIAYGYEENEGQNAVARNLASTLDLQDSDEGRRDVAPFRNEGGGGGMADLGDEESLSGDLLVAHWLTLGNQNLPYARDKPSRMLMLNLFRFRWHGYWRMKNGRRSGLAEENEGVEIC
jgi:hypothetical protein